MRKIVRLSDEIVMNALSSVPFGVMYRMETTGVVLAGGAIRDAVTGDEVKDVDIFCQSSEQSASIAGSFGYAVKKTTFSNSIQLSLPVQFVFYRAYESPSALIKQFDFLACAAAVYWSDTQQRFVGIALEGFEEDALAKRLTFLHQPKDEGSLVPLKRAMHFVAKGWTLPDTGLTGILNHFEPTLAVERVSRALRPGSYGGRR